VAGKLRRASANKHRRGPSTPRHKTLCYAIDLRGASLRITPFWRGTEKHLVGCKKREKIEKVTGSRDDKGKGDASIGIWCWMSQPQIPPLRFALVGMTIHILERVAGAQEKLSSRSVHPRWS